MFALDRPTFSNIVKAAAQSKREKYEEFLGKVTLLKEMIPYERQNLTDAIIPITFKAGEKIIKQGENGDKF